MAAEKIAAAEVQRESGTLCVKAGRQMEYGVKSNMLLRDRPGQFRAVLKTSIVSSSTIAIPTVGLFTPAKDNLPYIGFNYNFDFLGKN